MDRAREVAAWPNYPRVTPPSMYSEGPPVPGKLAMRALTGRSSIFERVLPTRPTRNQSYLRAVFLAVVDMDGVLYD